MSVPTWYKIAAYALAAPFSVFGGWLRAKQDALAKGMPKSVVGTVDNIRLSIAITVDHFRFPIATVASVVTFLMGLRVGILLTGGGLLVIRRFLGEEHPGDVVVPLGIALSLFLSAFLARYVYRKIMAGRD
jgi:uncharacterized membrane protein